MKAVQPRLTYPELRLMPDDGQQYALIDDSGGNLFFPVVIAGCDVK
jgi:hypothetical protein